MTLGTGLVRLAIAAGLALGWLAREVLLLAFLGLVIAVVMSFPVGRLSRRAGRTCAAPVVGGIRRCWSISGSSAAWGRPPRRRRPDCSVVLGSMIARTRAGHFAA